MLALRRLAVRYKSCSTKISERSMKTHATVYSFYSWLQGTNKSQFKHYKSMKLAHIEHPGDIDNAIPLCPLCHRNYDNEQFQGFIFIPEELEYFKSYEVEDMQKRLEEYQDTGIFRDRECPDRQSYRDHQLRTGAISHDELGGKYARYVLRDYFPKFQYPGNQQIPRVGQVFPPAAWHGDPTAALVRAFAILDRDGKQACNEETKPSMLGGLNHQLQELKDLYSRNEQYLRRVCGKDTHWTWLMESLFCSFVGFLFFLLLLLLQYYCL